ncbi:MAG TPA: GDP-mannose 4,6-dehydratase [Candidatus Saccharimonadales bacterium]|nr:GDP-mannose 4,6-dehydratase [Candidatus Saccharimonadales bacterium]
MAKRALITGITGQDGQYLAALLLKKKYQVSGLIRGQHNPKRYIIEEDLPAVELVEGDLSDMSSLASALEIAQPDEVYNLGAISFVALSFKQPELTGNITGLGALRLLEAIRLSGAERKVRYYQASTSELYGKVREVPQNELTPFHPRSPYGVAKAYAHHITVNYRESYGIHASCGILFNHESPKRGYEFVTRKITSSVARIKLGLQDDITLGNLDSKRDWGFAGDYVDGMWRMVQQTKSDDYVLATGETHSIKDFLDLAFKEIGVDDWKPYVKQDKRFMRPAEVDLLIGDPSKAKKKLGWEPKVKLPGLVKMMVENDLELESRKV